MKGSVDIYYIVITCRNLVMYICTLAELEITVGHKPFSDHFQEYNPNCWLHLFNGKQVIVYSDVPTANEKPTNF